MNNWLFGFVVGWLAGVACLAAWALQGEQKLRYRGPSYNGHHIRRFTHA